MLYVGIDPSITNTGVVVLNDTGALVVAVNGSCFCSHAKKARDIRRYTIQAQGVRDMLLDLTQLDGHEIGSIAYEGYSYGSTHKAYSLAEYNGILKSNIYMAYSEPLLVVPPTTNKKFATGYGGAEKDEMRTVALAECPLLGNVENLTSDICDAYFLALLAWYVDSPQQAATTARGARNLRIRLEIAKKFREEETP